MRTDFEVLREALEQIAQWYPQTDEGECMASVAKSALAELEDRERSRASGIAGYPRDKPMTAFEKLLADSKRYVAASEGHLRDSDFELDWELGDAHAELTVITFPQAEVALRAESTPQPTDGAAVQP